jgi:outer membrane immunogenic protein
MSRSFLSAVGVSCLLVAAPLGAASAADMPLKAPPPPPPAYSWTGCYIDGGWGYGMWNEDQNSETTALVATSVTTTTGGRGWLGRFGAGCDYQFSLGNLGDWVIGALGDYDFRSVSGTFADPFNGVVGNANQSSAWAVGGRLGYLVTPALLAYSDVGYTQARFGRMSLGPVAGGAAVDFASGNTYTGWFLGSGTEYALNFSWLPIRGLFWRNEYRYSSYNSADLQVTGAATFAEHIKPYDQTVTSSLVWRFNWTGR